VMQNYIPDVNRFNLDGPPVWWQRKLWEFDPSLVVVPSRQSCVYRLAQRRKLQLRENITNNALFNESDTKLLARYSLVPVTTIIATANWGNPYMFVELANRAPWRLGGHQKVNQMLDEQEAKDDLDKRAKTDEHLDYLGKDAWKLYNKKIGLRSHMYSPVVGRPAPQGATLKADQRTRQSPQSSASRSGSGSQRLIITP